MALMGLPRALLAGAWPNQAFESTAASAALVNLLLITASERTLERYDDPSSEDSDS